MKTQKSIYCIVDADDQLGFEMEQIQGGKRDKQKNVCKNGPVYNMSEVTVVQI